MKINVNYVKLCMQLCIKQLTHTSAELINQAGLLTVSAKSLETVLESDKSMDFLKEYKNLVDDIYQLAQDANTFQKRLQNEIDEIEAVCDCS